MVNKDSPNGQGPVRTSFRDRLAAAKKVSEGTERGVGEILSEAHETLLASREFFQAIADGDALGIALFRGVYGYSPQQAPKEWFARSWKEWRETIQSLVSKDIDPSREDYDPSKENDTSKKARGILAMVNVFEDNPVAAQTLGQVLSEIGRPSRSVHSANQFTAFLTDLAVKGLAIRSSDKPGYRKAFQWEGAYYTRTNVLKAKIAWPFVLKTLGRVRSFLKMQANVLPRIQELLNQATLSSDPEEQNLQRLLQRVTDEGSMVVLDPESQIRNKETGTYDPAGLLAILIERPDAGSSTLCLMGVVTDQPFPSCMTEAGTYELPPLAVHQQVDGELEIGFQIQNRLPEDEFAAVMRIQHLLRQGLRQEGRFRMPALPAPTSAR